MTMYLIGMLHFSEPVAVYCHEQGFSENQKESAAAAVTEESASIVAPVVTLHQIPYIYVYFLCYPVCHDLDIWRSRNEKGCRGETMALGHECGAR